MLSHSFRRRKFIIKVLLLNLSLSLIVNFTNAQNNLPSFFEIKTDTATYTTLPDSCWKMLEDKKNKLSFEEIRNFPIANQFHYNNTKNNELNYSINTYWFLYRLKNAMSQPVKLRQ